MSEDELPDIGPMDTSGLDNAAIPETGSGEDQLPSLSDDEPFEPLEAMSAFGDIGDIAGASEPEQPKSGAKAGSLAALQNIPVKVEAILGKVKMPIAELVDLGHGSVVDLDRRIGDPVDILVNDRLIARGEVVLVEEQLGVTVTEIVRQEG